MLETLVQGKIRLKLLTRLFLNPESRVYLRGLEKEFGVSSNTVRYELNKLSDLQHNKNPSKFMNFKLSMFVPLDFVLILLGIGLPWDGSLVVVGRKI